MKKCWQSNFFFIIVNIILLANLGFIFSKYVDYNEREIRDASIRDIEESSSDISKQLYRYMLQQQDTVENLASYITEAGLAEEEALLYLEHMKSLEGSLLLLEADTYKGYRFREDGRGESSGESSSERVSFATNTEIMEACEAAWSKESEAKALRATDSFSDNGREGSYVAFYQPLTIENCKSVLFYVLNISELLTNALSDLPEGNRGGILMEASGKVLTGEKQVFQGKDIENYYVYIKNAFGEENYERVRQMLETENSGNFTLTDSEGKDWLFTFAQVEETDGWVYLYLQLHMQMQMSDTARNVIMEAVLLMLLIGCFDVAIMLWQNRQLKKSLLALEAANRAKDSFISNMSHEIRTPINAVLGMDEMILRESTEEEILKYAYDIKNAGKTLLGIVNDILDFSKIESGKLEIIPAEYEIGSVINDLLNMIGGRASEKGLELLVNVNAGLPHLLYGDELRLKQIILNILTNAVKYTEKGSVTFSVDFEKAEEEQIYLRVAVKDTGIGMKPEEREKLFRPFERLDEKRNRTIEGTGLGMSIVSRLLEQMDSCLEVKSSYGEGSEFSFQLKQGVIDWEGIGELERVYQEAKKREDTQEGIFQAPAACILVVDDTPVNLTVVKGLLKRTRMQIDTAQSGKECLEKLQKKQYHVILLDHRMPEMDGIETLHRIKEMESPNKETPVIALTANAISGAYESYIKEGFCDFLSKPVNGNRLERMLYKYLPEEIRNKKEELPQIDSQAGISFCGSEEVYQQVIADFAATAEQKGREIQACLEKGELENYIIKVHTLKSSARLAGAMELSREAQYLEQCGEEGRLEELAAKTQGLLTNYTDIGIKLRGMLKEKPAADKEEIGERQLREALGAIREFSEAFDFDNVDEVMSYLEGCRLPAEAAPLYEALKTAVQDVDQEGIRRLTDTYLGGAERG